MNGEPRTFSEFVGQETIKKELSAMALADSRTSVLLRGAYGSGKTTLAKIYASSLGNYTYQDVPNNVDHLNPDARVHVIDEIHLLKDQEVLYNQFDELTFVFATTDAQELSAPFRSRCIELTLEPYSEQELRVILRDRATREGINADEKAIKILASRSRGTPRTGIQLLRRVHTIARMEQVPITARYTAEQLNEFRVYDNGFTQDDITYLRTLALADAPVSLRTLGAVLNRDRAYVQEIIESFLLRKNFVIITGRGRVLTDIGKEFVEEWI